VNAADEDSEFKVQREENAASVDDVAEVSHLVEQLKDVDAQLRSQDEHLHPLRERSQVLRDGESMQQEVQTLQQAIKQLEDAKQEKEGQLQKLQAELEAQEAEAQIKRERKEAQLQRVQDVERDAYEEARRGEEVVEMLQQELARVQAEVDRERQLRREIEQQALHSVATGGIQPGENTAKLPAVSEDSIPARRPLPPVVPSHSSQDRYTRPSTAMTTREKDSSHPKSARAVSSRQSSQHAHGFASTAMQGRSRASQRTDQLAGLLDVMSQPLHRRQPSARGRAPPPKTAWGPPDPGTPEMERTAKSVAVLHEQLHSHGLPKHAAPLSSRQRDTERRLFEAADDLKSLVDSQQSVSKRSHRKRPN